MNRTWVEIDLDALGANMREIRKATDKNALITAVVKADAYGHGAEEVSRVLLKNGADRLAVACIAEARHLRRCGFTVPILILGASEATDAEEIVKNDVTAAVFSYDVAKAISDAALKMKKTAKIHIKVDTGMSRIGVIAGENEDAAIAEIKEIAKLSGIEIEGVFSHFSTSDEKETDYTKKQLDIFLKFCERLKNEGVDIPIRHIANSAAIMMYPEAHLDMVRAGIVLYGLYPSEEVDKKRLPLIPVMRMKARITMVKEKEAGWGVSYGREYITEGRTKIATVPVGYADGYTRSIAKEGKILVKNETLAKIIGRICMDQCMIDVTNVNNINAGDEVTLFGEKQVTADDIAAWADTINYEVVCLISKRVPRVYIEGKKTVSARNYIDELL